jgi:ribosomal protein S18 acetylase RimI-like enzyme
VAPRSRTGAITSWCAARTTRCSGGATSCSSEAPPAADTDSWLERFAAEFPDAGHVALGFDGVAGRVDDLAGFTARGLTAEAATVMSAEQVRPPARPNRDATYRLLDSDADWEQSVELRFACRDDDAESGHLEFVVRKTETNRTMVEAGHGGWFGAFVDGVLVSQLGLFAASPGLARFQAVETHPDFRARGLAGTLVHHASRYGFGEFEARTLVMVADPDYVAVRVYRALGFADGERQLQAERAPR